jgi:hypothetical protein
MQATLPNTAPQPIARRSFQATLSALGSALLTLVGIHRH